MFVTKYFIAIMMFFSASNAYAISKEFENKIAKCALTFSVIYNQNKKADLSNKSFESQKK